MAPSVESGTPLEEIKRVDQKGKAIGTTVGLRGDLGYVVIERRGAGRVGSWLCWVAL